MTLQQKWKDLYYVAITETDWSRIEKRIESAEIAIQERRQEFAQNHGGTTEENQAIEDAVNGLKALRLDLRAQQSQKQTSMQDHSLP